MACLVGELGGWEERGGEGVREGEGEGEGEDGGRGVCFVVDRGHTELPVWRR